MHVSRVGRPFPHNLDAYAARANVKLLDPAFPRFLRASGAEASIAGPAGHSKAAVAIRNGELVGARVDLR